MKIVIFFKWYLIIKITTKLDQKRIKNDLELSRKLIKVLDEEKRIKKNILLMNAEEDRAELKQLDLQFLYLRKVHSFCYYCAAVN